LINKRMAENYVRDAEAILAEAKAARRRRVFHRVIRLAQESFELSLKGILRSIAVEYPKDHEVSDALRENSTRFPEWFQSRVAYLGEGSVWLAERRGPSMYGNEIAGKPASRLFTASDSRKALEYADAALKLAKRLLRELFGPKA
jgi:HEPN domain-containing protein